MVRLVAALALFAVGCRYEPPHNHGVPIPEPKFSAQCEDLMPLRVGHSVEPPRVLSRVAPRSVGVQGIVILATIIESSGRICDAVVMKGLNPEADNAALEAVRRWTFTAARLNGTPRAAVFHVTVKFD